jgi:hypothetical protein
MTVATTPATLIATLGLLRRWVGRRGRTRQVVVTHRVLAEELLGLLHLVDAVAGEAVVVAGRALRILPDEVAEVVDVLHVVCIDVLVKAVQELGFEFGDLVLEVLWRLLAWWCVSMTLRPCVHLE